MFVHLCLNGRGGHLWTNDVESLHTPGFKGFSSVILLSVVITCVASCPLLLDSDTDHLGQSPVPRGGVISIV